MSEKFSVKEISDITMSELRPMLEFEGFFHYKAKHFVKLENDILYLVSLYPHKNDFYVWCALYPLCEYKIWLGSAVIGGRFPSESEAMKVNTEEDLKHAISVVKPYLSTIFHFFHQRSNIQKLEESISGSERVFPLLVKGICLAYLGRPEEAKPYLQKFIDSGIWGGDSREGAQMLMEAISNGSHQALLEKNKADNIKKLRLRKFLPNS